MGRSVGSGLGSTRRFARIGEKSGLSTFDPQGRGRTVICVGKEISTNVDIVVITMVYLLERKTHVKLSEVERVVCSLLGHPTQHWSGGAPTPPDRWSATNP